MARVDKLIDKMRNRPNGIRFDEVEKVLRHHGYILVRSKGTSHYHFRNDAGNVITIPKENPVKAVYVKDVLRRIGR